MKSLIIASLVAFTAVASATKEAIQTISMKVTDEGFSPSEIKVAPGSHVVLKITRVTEDTCATQIKVKEKNLKKDLPMNKEVSVDLGSLKKGEIHFACGMDMITGHIIVE